MRAKLALVLEKAKTTKLQREILEGKYTRNEKIEADRVDRINAVKSALAALARSLGAKLSGQSHTEAQIRSILNNEFIAVCNEFAGTEAEASSDRRHN